MKLQVHAKIDVGVLRFSSHSLSSLVVAEMGDTNYVYTEIRFTQMSRAHSMHERVNFYNFYYSYDAIRRAEATLVTWASFHVLMNE